MGLGVFVTSDVPVMWAHRAILLRRGGVAILLWTLNLHCLRLAQCMASCSQVWGWSVVCHPAVMGLEAGPTGGDSKPPGPVQGLTLPKTPRGVSRDPTPGPAAPAPFWRGAGVTAAADARSAPVTSISSLLASPHSRNDPSPMPLCPCKCVIALLGRVTVLLIMHLSPQQLAEQFCGELSPILSVCLCEEVGSVPDLEHHLHRVPFPSPAGSLVWRHAAIFPQSLGACEKTRTTALTPCVRLCQAGGVLCVRAGPASLGPFAFFLPC